MVTGVASRLGLGTARLEAPLLAVIPMRLPLIPEDAVSYMSWKDGTVLASQA